MVQSGRLDSMLEIGIATRTKGAKWALRREIEPIMTDDCELARWSGEEER